MRDLGIPLAQGGLGATTFFFGGILGVLALNVVLAKVPLKRSLAGIAAVEVLALLAVAFLSEGTWSFAIAYFFVGFPCLVLAGIPGMWISVHLHERAAAALNIIVLASVSAMTLTPLVLGVLVSHGAGWRWIYAGEAVLALIAVALFAGLPLADITGRENLRPRHVRAVVAENPRLLAAIGVAAFLYLGGETILAVWLPKFQVEVFGASAAWAGLAVTFFWVGQISGRIATIPLTRRFLPSTLLAVLIVVMAAFALALAFSPTQAAALVLAYAVGLAASGCFSHIASYSSRFTLWHAGVVFSVFQVVGGVGAMVLPYIAGPVAAAWGFRAAIAIAAAPLLLVATLALVLRRTSGEREKGYG
jgi:fucose permease